MPDLLWFPAQWPETYSYTLSAALRHGLPVVCSDLGAPAQRLAGRPFSLILPWNSTPQVWLDALLTQAPAARSARSLPQASRPTRPLPEGFSAVKLPPRPANEPSWPTIATQLLAWPEQSRPPSKIATQALRVLYRLRNTSALAKLTQYVPRHWQRRVRLWLSKN